MKYDTYFATAMDPRMMTEKDFFVSTTDDHQYIQNLHTNQALKILFL